MLPTRADRGLTPARRCYILKSMSGDQPPASWLPLIMLNLDHSSRESAGSAPAATDEPLDPQALARLRELDPSGQGGLLARVLRAFEVSVARLVPQLEQGRASGDLQAVAHVAHTLKSSSASIGAMRLSQLCAECERRVRESRTEDLDPALDAMSAQIRLTLATLKRLLAAQT